MIVRRSILSAFALAGFGGRAFARDYPSRLIKIVLPSAAGGGSDIIARHIADRMRSDLGIGVVIENRPGAGGNIGADYVRTSDPDGYTLMVTAAAFAIAPSVNAKLPFDVFRDFTPITLIASVPLFVVTKSDSPFQSLADVIAAARRSDAVSFASFGMGSPAHLIGEVINQTGGVKMVHVPYRGGSLAVPDLLGGRTSIGILDAVLTGPLINSGQLRALAVNGPRRAPAFPNVPTLREAGVPFDTIGWHALFAPAGIAPEIAARINGIVNRIVARPDMKDVIETGGSFPIDPPTSVEDWKAGFARDVEAWGKIAREAGVQVQ